MPFQKDDLFIWILELDLFSNNELKVYNEWGDEVYKSRPYENDWEGTYNNSPLPVGVYYYILIKGDGSTPDNGFVHIER